MKKNILLRTNLFIGVIIVLGFIITSVISYNSNKGIFKKDIERVSALTTEGIYHHIDSIFTKPINVSLTMANDSLLKSFLRQEEERLEDDSFIQNMKAYLLAYKVKYNYDSVFLVSTETNRYYHFNGIDRVLAPDEAQDIWYYNFLAEGEEYSINIDDDQAAENEITVFINCKIKDESGHIQGVVGVGFQVTGIQEIFKEYEKRADVEAYLIDRNGDIQLSTNQSGYQTSGLFEGSNYPELREAILSGREAAQSFWYSSQNGRGYLVTRYVPNLEWFLVIDNDTSVLNRRLNRQFVEGVLVIFIVITLVLLLIMRIIHRYNTQIIELTVEKEQEHQMLFRTATEQMYENIYELDITHNCAASEAAEQYFESLGVPPHTPYDLTLRIIAEKQIKAEFRQGYVDTFKPSNVLKAYENGIESLQYDFMVTNNGSDYYWMRITTRIFCWNEDHSIHMFTYRQNIDQEKRQEKRLLEQMERDSLSGLYNKAATQEHIQRLLSERSGQLYAFFIFDIDNFKLVNDTFGHAAGDQVIADFARRLKAQFRAGDLVGRIGGDEFVAFIPASSVEWVEEKAESLVEQLRSTFTDEESCCNISTSIGVSVASDVWTDFETFYKNADRALYRTKEKGKDGYTIFEEDSVDIM